MTLSPSELIRASGPSRSSPCRLDLLTHRAAELQATVAKVEPLMLSASSLFCRLRNGLDSGLVTAAFTKTHLQGSEGLQMGAAAALSRAHSEKVQKIKE